MTGALIEAQGLGKSYGVHRVLRGIDLAVGERELVCDKYSSLAAVISVGEVTRRGMELSAGTFRPLEIFSFIGVVYFVICWPLSYGVRLWERRLARR
jgi:ABC-type arginine/histidine transport system permease subunit